MNGSGYRKSMGWGGRLLIGLVLVLIGAAAATWGLAHYRPAARIVGIAPSASEAMAPKPVVMNPPPQAPQQAAQPSAAEAARIADIEARLARVENSSQRAEGFAGRADALVVSFAARRAIDRGVALGFLEPLLIDRFAHDHQGAVATIISASRQPVRLNDLMTEYETLGPVLRSGGSQDSWWADFKRELGSVVAIHRSDRPSSNPEARYNRALRWLSAGDVDRALAETMRLPGAAGAGDWVAKARRYIAAHRALDEIESAALLTGPSAAA